MIPDYAEADQRRLRMGPCRDTGHRWMVYGLDILKCRECGMTREVRERVSWGPDRRAAILTKRLKLMEKDLDNILSIHASVTQQEE